MAKSCWLDSMVMPVAFVAGASWLRAATTVKPSAVKTAQKANTGRFWTSFGIENSSALNPTLPNDCTAAGVASQSQPPRQLYRACRAESRNRAGTLYLLFSQRTCVYFLLETQMARPRKQKADVRQGTLALMVLKTLDVLGPLHGYGIARRIEQISGDLLAVNQGTPIPCC